MKTRRMGLFNLLIILSLSSCKDSSTNANTGVSGNVTVTFNGGGYVNQSYTMVILSSEAYYDTVYKVTTCKIVGTPSNYLQEIDLSFGNYRPGIYYWNGASSLFIGLDSLQTKKSSKYWYWYSTYSGVTTISSYGNVGESISGEFAGKVVPPSLIGSDTISVKGMFSIKRTK